MENFFFTLLYVIWITVRVVVVVAILLVAIVVIWMAWEQLQGRNPFL